MKKIIATIIKESLRIVILASLLSSIGGIGLELIQKKLIAILPLLIVFPALNNMIGNFGTIISANFTTLLFTKQLHAKWKSKKLKELLHQLAITAFFSSILLATIANLIAYYKGFPLTLDVFLKVLLIVTICVSILVTLICLISITAGFYYYHLNEDPDNVLIALATSIADLGALIIFSVLIYLIF
ncbi:MAG: magnesium transporter [Nanoarchaeota archaeon]|nr:magnesium transporter [Nanoarchaeota archaeon]